MRALVLVSLVGLVSASSMLVSRSASADEADGAAPAEPTKTATAPADKPKDEAPNAGLKGFEIMLRPSFGGAPSDSPIRFAPTNGVQLQGDPGALMKGAAPWGSGFVGQAYIGYRFVPFLSAGLRAGFRNASGSNLSDGSSNLSRSAWDAGLYARFYPAAFAPSVSKYIDPWVSAGVGYARDTQTFDQNLAVSGGGSVKGHVALDHHAISIPLGIGIDYRVTKFLSVGPSFELAINNPIVGCAETTASGFSGTTYCSNTSPGKDFVKAETYMAWNAGLDVKATF